MKIGVKIWPDKAEYAFQIAEHADFIEVMAKRGEDFSFLGDIDMPLVVHAEHGALGVNYADSSKPALSKESVEFALRLADRLDARTIIVHPGFLDGTPVTKPESSVEFLKGLNDSRIAIENVLLKDYDSGKEVEGLFATPEKMNELLSAVKKPICLDFSHAHTTAVMLGMDYMEMLGKFMQLRPRHFHVCGGVEGEPKDMHIHLWEGNFNIGAFRRMLPKDAWVTLETPCDLEGQIRDIEIMRS